MADRRVARAQRDPRLQRAGADSLRPNFGGGRPRRITADQRKRIVAVAGARPDSQGVPLTRWSLSRLALHLRSEGIVISPAHLSRVLRDAGPSFQRTRPWKASPDPDYEAKAERVLSLCVPRRPSGPSTRPPAGGVERPSEQERKAA